MQAQVYIYEIALQPVKVMGEHSHRASSIVLPGSLPSAPLLEGHLEDKACRAGACLHTMESRFVLLPAFSLQITSLTPAASLFLSAK